MRKEEEEERNPEKCEDLDGSWSDDTEDGRRGRRRRWKEAAKLTPPKKMPLVTQL